MKITFAHCNLLDGNENMVIQKNVNVIIENDKIIAIDSDKVEGTIINCANKYICPGLINMHVHLSSDGSFDQEKMAKHTASLVNSNILGKHFGIRLCQKYAYTQLMSGVTTMRCVGGLSDVDSQIRDKVNQGKTIGPRMIVANRAITMKDGYMNHQGAYEVSDLEESKDALNRLLKTKPDFIKIMVTGSLTQNKINDVMMPEEIIRYVTATAHHHHIQVAAHAQNEEGVRRALENGVDIIEYGSHMDERLQSLYLRKGAKIISVLSGVIPYAKFDNTVTAVSNEVKENAKNVLDGVIDNVKQAIQHEIPVGIGNDAGRPFVRHSDFYRELIYFKNYMKVSNQYTLYCATKRNAQLLNIDSITGTVEVGKKADFLILDENPIKDLKALSKINTVVFEGRVFSHPSIKKNRINESIWNMYG
ncbi:MAG: amidohydrolase family protein [Erysipelotrichaceae bacterium]|uniref:amidohydrolase family protein n=1 Tax=Floccifex sp. TaxID=2815810 RepID=UPI002A747B17|nr:amidohydrolase family protein [Floccifex sp.]MDD7282070.1 amidohydrolase family protein [Erysipelotrichaceae bacterium]MDY2958980.1 amidohydrolase family protein [Floccifex sp.]